MWTQAGDQFRVATTYGHRVSHPPCLPPLQGAHSTGQAGFCWAAPIPGMAATRQLSWTGNLVRISDAVAWMRSYSNTLLERIVYGLRTTCNRRMDTKKCSLGYLHSAYFKPRRSRKFTITRLSDCLTWTLRKCETKFARHLAVSTFL